MKLVDFLDNSNQAGTIGVASNSNFTHISQLCAEQATEPAIYLRQLYQVQDRLRSDLLACDVRFSLFVAAANSYRYEKLLRPFPKEFLDGNQRPNIGAIFQVVADIDRLEVLLEQLSKGNFHCYHKDVLNLLYVVLVRHGERFALSTLRPCEFEDLYAHLKTVAPQVQPTQIFEVTPSLKCTHTKVYTRLREQYPVRIGFYGARVEQLYAMLTVGSLPVNTCLELTSDVDEALRRSPQTPGWGGSRCGALLRCVAVVEYVVKPAFVNVEPNGRYVSITDANCIQISYLMFFGQSFEKKRSARVRQPKLSINLTESLKWMEGNKYALSVGMYLMLMSLTTPSGRGIMHRFACYGFYVLRKAFLKI